MTWKSRPPRSAKASIAARLIERAPWLPPMTKRQRASAAIPNRRARRVAIGPEHGGGHRPPGHQVALPLTARDREGEADPPRAARQQPVGKAEVAVGLGEDEWDAGEDRGQPRGPGDEAAAAHHDVRPAAADRPPRAASTAASASIAAAAARSGLRRSIPRTLRLSIS